MHGSGCVPLRDQSSGGRLIPGSAELDQEDQRRLEAARGEFDAEVTYLDHATMGLPPRRSWEALQTALSDWRAGTADAVAYDQPLAASRAAYAALVGVPGAWVAVGSQVSVFAGLIAACVPDGSEILTASGDFTSILFPFHAQAGRGVTVREVPLDRLPDAVTSRTALVSVAAVQSADGRLVDLDALEAACAGSGSRVLLDLTQAAGWLPVQAGRFAYTVAGGYKWLLAPRGTAYMTVQPELLGGLAPHNAGWFAGADRWASIYGSPLRLAEDARRFDVSPAWLSWVGAAPALELLAGVGPAALHDNALRLANRFRAGVGLPAGNSAIVSVSADPQVPDLVRAAGIAASVRVGRLRLSFHVSTSTDDVDRVVTALAGHVHV